MPILANAKKALRGSRRKARVNALVRSRMRSALKKANIDPSAPNIAAAYSSVDKAAKTNLIHANKAARLKSQVSRLAK